MEKSTNDSLPFGIDMRTGLQGLAYQRLEVYLDEVPHPHEYFKGYRVLIFSNSESFSIRADTDRCESHSVALDIFKQVYEELASKYDVSFSGKSNSDLDFDFYLENSLNPSEHWLFEIDENGEPQLAWIKLSVAQDEINGWLVTISYSYHNEREKSPL